MPVRTTVDLPDDLYAALRARADSSGSSMRSLILRALENAYRPASAGSPVTGPLIKGGKRGPRFPLDENPHDFLLP